jgi:hypothetical protein
MKGKTASREMPVLASFSTTLIEPTFIYGGGSFHVNTPHRVLLAFL